MGAAGASHLGTWEWIFISRWVPHPRRAFVFAVRVGI
jgi:hypothetical protein